MIGSLVYADVHEVADPAILNNPNIMREVVEVACRRGGATVLGTYHHSFSPQGLTVVSILAESHAAVHTYPEEAAYMIDVFTCGDQADPTRIAEAIVWTLGGTARYERTDRGDRRAAA